MEHVTVGDLVKATGGTLLCGKEEDRIHKIRLDSRTVEPGDLFVPLIGEKVDGHTFIPQVVRLGAGAVLTSRENEQGAKKPGVKEPGDRKSVV